MKLSSIKFINFKNYEEANFHFQKKIISIVGNNGVGKTNLLDGIYYTCIGKSNFQSSDKLIVKTSCDFFRIESHYHSGEESIKINLKIKPGTIKELEVNGNKITKLSDHIGLIPVVIICPDDINKLLAGNEDRRNFINNTIIQYDKEYLVHLNVYNKLLKQRNALLSDFSERQYYDKDLLEILTQNMSKPAQYIFEARKSFVAQLEEHLLYYGQLLSEGKENMSFEYVSKLASDNFINLSNAKIQIDKITNRTNSGVHKDEVELMINKQLIKDFASQGQLKSYVFALKLAQYQLLCEKTHRKPIFLLDDVFDKLDSNRVSQLLNILMQLEIDQVFITTTDKFKIQALVKDESQIEEIEIR